jgi:hypothetical protein
MKLKLTAAIMATIFISGCGGGGGGGTPVADIPEYYWADLNKDGIIDWDEASVAWASATDEQKQDFLDKYAPEYTIDTVDKLFGGLGTPATPIITSANNTIYTSGKYSTLVTTAIIDNGYRVNIPSNVIGMEEAWSNGWTGNGINIGISDLDVTHGREVGATAGGVTSSSSRLSRRPIAYGVAPGANISFRYTPSAPPNVYK